MELTPEEIEWVSNELDQTIEINREIIDDPDTDDEDLEICKEELRLAEGVRNKIWNMLG